MRLIVVGAMGMLGSDLIEMARRHGLDVRGYDRPEIDITKDCSGLEAMPGADWVVNCAAYTDVDRAESDSVCAFAVNADGARRVAEWCAKTGARCLHLSTDYVFDGASSVPYREDDPTAPLNVYGASKLAGEKAVLEVSNANLVVRTQALFGRGGRNFVSAITARLDARGVADVVNDQWTCPTYTVHLADAILRLMRTGKNGIVHVSASGRCTWYEFAAAIAARVRPSAKVTPTSSSAHVRPARRPAFSVLDKTRYTAWTGVPMPAWPVGLDDYLREEKEA